MNLAPDVDLEDFVTTKDELSGADIKAVCTEAGLLALRERRMRVTKADMEAAREKVGLLLYTIFSSSFSFDLRFLPRFTSLITRCFVNLSLAFILSVVGRLILWTVADDLVL